MQPPRELLSANHFASSPGTAEDWWHGCRSVPRLLVGVRGTACCQPGHGSWIVIGQRTSLENHGASARTGLQEASTEKENDGVTERISTVFQQKIFLVDRFLFDRVPLSPEPPRRVRPRRTRVTDYCTCKPPGRRRRLLKSSCLSGRPSARRRVSKVRLRTA